MNSISLASFSSDSVEGQMRQVQLNMRHCQDAAAKLLSLSGSEVEIALVQKPYMYNHKVSGLRNKNFASSSGDKVKTCVVGRTKLD